MHLLTLGDSFTYGEELVSQTLAWPELLAAKLGSTVTNLGLPGNSNTAMCRQLLEYFVHTESDCNITPDLVVIGWSSPGRLEFSDDVGTFSVWPGYSGNLFREHQPWREDLVTYINKFHSAQYLFKKYLHDVVFAQSFLKTRGVRCIMMNTVGNDYYRYTNLQSLEYYTYLLDTTDFTGWPNDGMAEWTYGCQKGPRGHFLEKGHAIVAEKIYEHYGNSSRVSRCVGDSN